jgi:hypothetical protein
VFRFVTANIGAVANTFADVWTDRTKPGMFDGVYMCMCSGVDLYSGMLMCRCSRAYVYAYGVCMRVCICVRGYVCACVDM